MAPHISLLKPHFQPPVDIHPQDQPTGLIESGGSSPEKMSLLSKNVLGTDQIQSPQLSATDMAVQRARLTTLQELHGTKILEVYCGADYVSSAGEKIHFLVDQQNGSYIPVGGNVDKHKLEKIGTNSSTFIEKLRFRGGMPVTGPHSDNHGYYHINTDTGEYSRNSGPWQRAAQASTSTPQSNISYTQYDVNSPVAQSAYALSTPIAHGSISYSNAPTSQAAPTQDVREESEAPSEASTTDGLLESMNENWDQINSSTHAKRTYLRTRPTNREDIASRITTAGFAAAVNTAKSFNFYAESRQDDVAVCNPSAKLNASIGAGPCVSAFLRAFKADGSYVDASIHRSITNGEHAFDPVSANDRILRPLEAEATRQIGEPTAKHFYFTGGDHGSIDSCVALMYAAEQRGLDVKACLMPMNRNNTCVDAMLTTPQQSNAHGFYIAPRPAGPAPF